MLVKILKLLFKFCLYLFLFFFVLLLFFDPDLYPVALIILILFFFRKKLLLKIKLILNKKRFSSEKNSDITAQSNSISIDDMYQFNSIPFEWKYVKNLHLFDDFGWFMLNKNNQYVALHYISSVSDLISSFSSISDILNDCIICTEDIDFSYHVPTYLNSPPCTYVKCRPYTQTGKNSKYPVVLHFESSEYVDNVQTYPIIGEIEILTDGNIGRGYVHFLNHHLKIEFGLYGISLCIKKIKDTSTSTTLYKL